MVEIWVYFVLLQHSLYDTYIYQKTVTCNTFLKKIYQAIGMSKHNFTLSYIS